MGGNQLVTAISFRLLGPLEVSVGGRAVPLGGVKPRTLLAALVLEAGVTVSVGQLVDVLWPREPPRSATANIRTYVHFLRRNLAGNGTELVDRIQSRSSGYVLHAAGDEIDSVVFEANVARAHDAIARGDRSAALEMLSAVEGLWRG
jgi:DNA-binding SARP family transcriptional activator